MSKHNAAVLFFGPLTLNPGVNGRAVERFYVEEYLPNVTELPGYRLTLYKGRAGKRAGQYLYIGHFEKNRAVATVGGGQSGLGRAHDPF